MHKFVFENAYTHTHSTRPHIYANTKGVAPTLHTHDPVNTERDRISHKADFQLETLKNILLCQRHLNLPFKLN